jgi:hypothetical protein
MIFLKFFVCFIYFNRGSLSILASAKIAIFHDGLAFLELKNSSDIFSGEILKLNCSNSFNATVHCSQSLSKFNNLFIFRKVISSENSRVKEIRCNVEFRGEKAAIQGFRFFKS